jgi:hypothetical protein
MTLLRVLIVNCTKLRAQVQQLAKKICKDPKNPHIRAVFASTKKLYKQTLKRTKIEFKSKLVKELENTHVSDTKMYWGILESLKQIDKEQPVNPISAKAWVKHFSELYTSDTNNEVTNDYDIIDELQRLEKIPTFNELSFPISQKEIQEAISSLKSGKAAGPDNLSAELIKATKDQIVPSLTKIFNHIMATGMYPASWAQGIITPLHKKGSPLLTDNYRAITVSSCLGKVFGITMNTRLKHFIKKHSIIDDRQASHKEGSRTTDNLFIMRTLFDKYCKGKKGLYACFIDFRKAFDSVWHEGLFLKLLRNGIAGPYYKVIKNMYSKSTSCVKLHHELTDSFPILKGVKQGDTLSPLLFNIFINDLIKELNNENSCPPTLDGQTIGSLLYADDLILLSTSQVGLQNSLNKLSDYCKKWKLEVNRSKSQTMHFTKTGKSDNHTFSFNDQSLEWVNNYSYLGLELSSNCSFRKAEENMCRKASKAMFKLKSLLNNTNISPGTGLKLFDQLIKPIALYGSEIWGPDVIKSAWNNQCQFNQSLYKFACEKLNTSFSKFLLGVHKKAQNTAVRGELGRYPLGIDIMANCILYQQHLLSGKTSQLLSHTFKVNKILPGDKTWSHKVSKVYENLISRNIPLHNSQVKISRKLITGTLKDLYKTHWLDELNSQHKMRTYVKIKDKFCMEDYLISLASEHRKSLTRFRISAHNLAIERGRYTKPPTALQNRTCLHCPSHVEDEHHFLLDCTAHMQSRIKLFRHINEVCPNFENLADDKKFIFMLSAGDDLIKHVAQFIHNNCK